MSKAILPNPSQLIGTEVKLSPSSIDHCPDFRGEIELIAGNTVSCKILTRWGGGRIPRNFTLNYNRDKVLLNIKDLQGLIEQRILE